MYESVRGTLKDKTPHQAIVECGGVGYRLSIPLSTYMKLPHHEAGVFLYVSQVIREDAHTLYGFLAKDERDLFETLLSISGIGPKTAAGIIGHMEISAFQRAIGTADTRLLSKLPGIGKKTAERLVIEMRDKFKPKGRAPGAPIALSEADGVIGDAMNALINLGYNAMDANKAVQDAVKASKEELNLAQLISAALRHV